MLFNFCNIDILQKLGKFSSPCFHSIIFVPAAENWWSSPRHNDVCLATGKGKTEKISELQVAVCIYELKDHVRVIPSQKTKNKTKTIFENDKILKSSESGHQFSKTWENDWDHCLLCTYGR